MRFVRKSLLPARMPTFSYQQFSRNAVSHPDHPLGQRPNRLRVTPAQNLLMLGGGHLAPNSADFLTMTNAVWHTRAGAVDEEAATSDDELLVRYRDRGDVQAFEEIVHRYEKPLYNYLVRYLHNAALAEEVFQATFLRLHEKCGLYTENRPVRPWLYSIATHQAIDAVRKEGRHQVARLDEQHKTDDVRAGTLLNLLENDTPSPLEQLEAHERAEWTRRAVHALPQHLRVVILLIYFQGLKYREAAQVLDICLGTVKSRVHKALLALNIAWRREHPKEQSYESGI